MSILPEGLSLGPITLPPHLLGLVVTLLLGLAIAKRDFQKRGLPGESWSDTLLYTVVVWWLTSRLSAFVLEPSASFAQPVTTMLSGGVPFTEEIASVAAVLFFVWRVRKLELSGGAVLDGLARLTVLAVAVMSLFVAAAGTPTDLPWGVVIGEGKYHPINLYLAGAAGVLLAWLIWRSKERKAETEASGSDLFRVLFWLGSALVVLSFWQVHLERVMGLAPLQWAGLGMAVAGYVGPLVWKPGRRKDT